jgi:hypothetical protein
LDALFFRGALDKDMCDKVRLMDATFVVTDLRFFDNAEGSGVQVSDGDLSTAEHQQHLAEFKVFALRLQAEQANWKRFLAARRDFDDSNQATLTRFREAAYDAMEQAVIDHASVHYSCACLATRSHMLSFLEQSLQGLAESPPAVAASTVLRVNVYNLPMLGQNYSRGLTEIAETIRNEATHHPSTSISIVFLPNTSEWGKGMEPSKQLHYMIAQARQNVIAKFHESEDSLTIIECVAMFDMSTMYSKDRELRVDFLCIFSSMTDDSETPISLFARSFLVRRRGVPGLLPVMHRKDYKDFTKAIIVIDGGNMDHALERRQWLSGVGLFRGILTALFKDMGLTKSTTCQVRDLTPYDDQLALAIIELNGPASDSSIPTLGYAAGTWKELPGALHIAAHIQANVEATLLRLINARTYILPGFRGAGQEPKIDEGLRPTIAEDSFKICNPRANDELPIRQAFYDQWSKNTATADLWKELVAAHDKEFNKTGVPFKVRRAAETPIEEMPDANAITIPPDASGPTSKEALLKESTCQEVKAFKSPASIIATETGQVYVAADEDTVLDKKDALFVLRGRFRVGQAAESLIGQGLEWHSW